MKKYFKIAVVAFMAVFTLSLSSCSKDDDNPDGGGNSGVIYVNGKKWTSTNLPNYEGENFHFIGKSSNGESHVVIFNESLEDVEKGEDITPDYVFFPTENAEYEYEDGDVIVKTTNYPKSVTVKFDNYTVTYKGKYISGMGDNRNPDIEDEDELVFNGTVTFWAIP